MTAPGELPMPAEDPRVEEGAPVTVRHRHNRRLVGLPRVALASRVPAPMRLPPRPEPLASRRSAPWSVRSR